MKRSFIVLALMVIPALVLAQGTSPVANPAAGIQAASAPVPTPTVDAAHAPKITCANPNFDFHNVDEGPDITHKFRVVNRGKSTLKIKSVSTSCGCTAAVAGSKYPVSPEDKAQGFTAVIPAGASDNIVATFHTAGRPGHSTKFITVTSNDPANPTFQLKLDMTVVREVDVQPDRLYLYGIKHGQPHPSDIKVLGKPGKPLKVLSVKSANGVVTITSVTPVNETQDNRTGADIQVDVPVTLAIGNFTDSVVIETDDLKKPEVTVQVMGEVTGKIQYNPKSLYFAPHQDMPVTVNFTSDQPQSFAIRSVESAKHLVRPHIVRTTGANGFNQYLLVVSVIKDIPKDSDGKDQVIVHTNDDEMSTISIDVQANK